MAREWDVSHQRRNANDKVPVRVVAPTMAQVQYTAVAGSAMGSPCLAAPHLLGMTGKDKISFPRLVKTSFPGLTLGLKPN